MMPLLRSIGPSGAARQLGISAKALRLYERHGLIAPERTAAGWRTYTVPDMARAARIVALRALGLGLAQIARALSGEADQVDLVLADHEATLQRRVRHLADAIAQVRDLRAGLGRRAGWPFRDAPAGGAPGSPAIAFDLPWPWGGERFTLSAIRPLTHITGPLGSGKTRLARQIAATLPDAVFLGLDRLDDDACAARARLDDDAGLRSRVDHALSELTENGATACEALVPLLVGLADERPAAIVVDMPEQRLDRASQQALVASLRRRGPDARPLFLLTRSCSILDLAIAGSDEAIIYCPANHAPPIRVTPCPGAPGYEAVATCLASPEVRKRTEGVIAWRPPMP